MESVNVDEDKNPDSEENPPKRDNPKRILIYTTWFLLSLFGHAEEASVDGTFKSIPLLWTQLFIVMLKFGGVWVPVMYAWLPDKRTDTYKTFFLMLKLTLEKHEIHLNLKSVKMDFEIGIHIGAMILKGIKTIGCLFHYRYDLFFISKEFKSPTLNFIANV